MTHLARIADRVLNRPLMILPDKLSLIASVLDGRIGIDAAGLVPSTSEDDGVTIGAFVRSDRGNPDGKPYRTTPEGVAIIGVVGSLVNRGGWIGARSGMTSYEGLKHQLGTAARDASVSSILLDVDTPGGEAVGAFEVGDMVAEVAKQKQVVAVVNGMAASAGYAIISGASQIVTTSSGISGSIGVVMLHADYSNRLHQAGIVPTMIFAGARKVDGNPYEKLTSEVKGELKAEIDRFYALFVAHVARHRKGLSKTAVRDTQARTYIGADAVTIGLADAVGSFEGALAVLQNAARAATGRAGQKRSAFLQSALTAEDATAAAVRRVANILGSQEAVGVEGMAKMLALQPAHVVTEEAALEILRVAKQTTPAIGPRASDSPYGLILEIIGRNNQQKASA
jgi:signal peptide peptidase SppA